MTCFIIYKNVFSNEPFYRPYNNLKTTNFFFFFKKKIKILSLYYTNIYKILERRLWDISGRWEIFVENRDRDGDEREMRQEVELKYVRTFWREIRDNIQWPILGIIVSTEICGEKKKLDFGGKKWHTFFFNHFGFGL